MTDSFAALGRIPALSRLLRRTRGRAGPGERGGHERRQRDLQRGRRPLHAGRPAGAGRRLPDDEALPCAARGDGPRKHEPVAGERFRLRLRFRAI